MGIFSEMDTEQRYGAGETEQECVEPFQVGQTAVMDVPEPDDEAEQQAEADAAPAEMEKLMGKTPEPEDKSSQVAAEQTEDEKRKAHEEAEAKRKAEFDAKQKAKKEKEAAEIARVAAMSDDEVMMASMQQVSAATERLTRRNMKECVSEYVQTKCLEDPAFARLTMHPLKSMIRCFWYINRKAREYLEKEMKDNDVKPEQGYAPKRENSRFAPKNGRCAALSAGGGIMIAYKGFEPGLICRGYQFHMGKNVTDKANCRANGFHCAEDPLDCLTYYPDMAHSEYYLVNAGGDVDEDDNDTKISCTELTILHRLNLQGLLLHALAYMVDHPLRERNEYVQSDRGVADRGFAIVRGIAPVAKGQVDDYLAFAQESPDGRKILQVAILRVDGKTVQPNIWYNLDGEKEEVKVPC